MSKTSQWVINNPQENTDSDYWFNRYEEMEQKYSHLLTEIGDMLASVIVKEMGVQK